MTADQAKALARAADALPEEIGTSHPFNLDGHPNCAIGFMARRSGFTGTNAMDAYIAVERSCGLTMGEVDSIWMANDACRDDATRRAAVIAVIERIIGEHGHDVAALRKERGERG